MNPKLISSQRRRHPDFWWCVAFFTIAGAGLLFIGWMAWVAWMIPVN